MRKLSVILMIGFIFLTVSFTQAQDITTMPHRMHFRVLFVDYAAPNGFPTDSVGWTNGIEIGYTNLINKNFAFSIPVKYNLANFDGRSNATNMLSVDAIGRIQPYNPASKMVPYVMFGGGVAMERDSDINIQFPLGLGTQFKLAEHSLISIQGEYRFSQKENRNNLQLGIGATFVLGKMDEDEDTEDFDGDGVPDSMDNCPDEAGPLVLGGCPDRDMDGVVDQDDECPDTPGPVENKGCPDLDRDGDGIVNELDACPDQAGPPENNGCPNGDRDGDGLLDLNDDCPDQAGPIDNRGCPLSDRDGDGIVDSKDKCPDQKGLIELFGCPDGDIDGDGIPDSKDLCPNMAGTEKTGGCPEMNKEEKETLEYAGDNVEFQFGKSTLLPESYDVLDQVIAILNRYPDFQLEITGHTDDVGRKENNMLLSIDRAQACADYIKARGIDDSRLTIIGKGELSPLDSNKTDAGRRKNRRVEFNVLGQ